MIAPMTRTAPIAADGILHTTHYFSTLRDSGEPVILRSHMPEIDPLLGKTIGPCRLEALIGRGGMGRVYKAHHLLLNRCVAVKLVDVGDTADGINSGAACAQILAEARSAAKLDDPRIVAIHEVGTDGGIPYIVMQWVDGETLEARVERLGPLPPAEALEIIRETATALEVSHKAGIVHRDIKPGNILLGARGTVKLTDFGIARIVEVSENTDTALGGSFHFMAPEQSFGGAPDPRSDLYALGATWYYALTGKPPYPGSPLDALMRHRDEAPPEVRLLRPEITERAASLLRRMMAKKVQERPISAGVICKEMLSSSMLLETDASGSPFKILPAGPRIETLSTAATAISLSESSKGKLAFPPPPPAPKHAAALGSKRYFIFILSTFGIIAFGFEWRRAGPEDWPAGAAFLALLPAALSFGNRRTATRQLLSSLGCAGALACWLKQTFSPDIAMSSIESIGIAGVGLCALLGSAYLGQWGRDRSEAVIARFLGPAAGLCLLLSALTWKVPETQPWTTGLAECSSAWWSAFINSGGGWRWLGTAGLCVALGTAMRLKVQDTGLPKDRKPNWNK